MKFNQKELESICRLLQTNDFKSFLGGLARSAEESNKNLVMRKLDSGDLHNLQGYTKALVILTETIVQAPSEINKLSQPKT